MKYIFIVFTLFLTTNLIAQSVSFTFDDGSLADTPNHTAKEWNTMLLDKLNATNVKAILFVTGNNMHGEKGNYLLSSWNDNGHKIANHTFLHANYNNESRTFEDFRKDFIKNDSIINKYSNYKKLFRFPYLKEGNTKEKVASVRFFFKRQGYKNGYVTIDASDWYINSRLIKRLRKNNNADISDFRKFYLKHVWERALFYEKLSFELTGRHIKHNLLLHHNLASALFIDDLIKMFKTKGWQITSAEEAFNDPIYEKKPTYAGESLIYALAKDSENYENLLRYPAEDSKYEKEKMDDLGL
ncbi:polysaccharide deacetylase family protein [Maribacter sp.]|uniref:polysaccharide deacetylase family protein n=1 Tax=Maribacter sp. TaxID=1897614 RepID=UPI0025C06B89|nr:polysaccharide deacetylase family protein [Maribacter sp.]